MSPKRAEDCNSDNVDTDIVYPNRMPPKVILQKFVEATNMQRDASNEEHVVLNYIRGT